MIVNLRRRRRLAVLLAAVLLAGLTSLGLNAVRIRLFPRKYAGYVQKYCDAYGIDPNLAYAVIHTESGFDSQAVSCLGACGLMQIMPETFEWLRSKVGGEGAEPDIFDPETNIRYGVFYLSLLRERFGDETLMIAAYHAGMSRVSGWLDDAAFSSDGRTLHTIPFRDTQHYVRKVERAKRIYEVLY